jgi:hypothetical protein
MPHKVKNPKKTKLPFEERFLAHLKKTHRSTKKDYMELLKTPKTYPDSLFVAYAAMKAQQYAIDELQYFIKKSKND